MANGNIFISYRRGADSNAAGRLYDRLERHFDKEQLFFDIDAIPLGVDFTEYIDGKVAQCDALLVVIGEGFLSEIDRLSDPDDFVRIEIEAALNRHDIPVIPVLFEGAQMPRRDELPNGLQPLARRNAIELSHAQFAQIVDGRLIEHLDKALSEREGDASDTEAKRSVHTRHTTDMEKSLGFSEASAAASLERAKKGELKEHEQRGRDLAHSRTGRLRVLKVVFYVISACAIGYMITLGPLSVYARFSKVGFGKCTSPTGNVGMLGRYQDKTSVQCKQLCLENDKCTGVTAKTFLEGECLLHWGSVKATPGGSVHAECFSRSW